MESQVSPSKIQLITEPYLKVRIIELIHNYEIVKEQKLYCRVSIGNKEIIKTEALESNNKIMYWDQGRLVSLQEEFYSSFINFQIFDYDQFLSHDLFYSQQLPLKYFALPQNRGKILDIYFVMFSKQENEQNEFKDGEDDGDNQQAYNQEQGDNQEFNNDQQFTLSDFNEEEFSSYIIQKSEIPKNEDSSVQNKISLKNENYKNSKIPLLHIQITMMDYGSLFKLTSQIVGVKRQKRFIKPDIFFYEILMQRNDGLKWIIQRRYKQINKFREQLLDYYKFVKNIPFPPKNNNQILSVISSESNIKYQENAENRIKDLQFFFDQLLLNDELYTNKQFINFFDENFDI